MSSRWLVDVYEGTIDVDYAACQGDDMKRKPHRTWSLSQGVPQLDLTIYAFENILIDCLRQAAEHSDRTLRHQQEIGVEHSHRMRVGMFCTSLRSQMTSVSDKLRWDRSRFILDTLCYPAAWRDILVPAAPTYPYNYKLALADGEWTLNYEKTRELTQSVQTGYRFVDEEALIHAECTESLRRVESSIPTLTGLANQAHMINIQADEVLARMTAIAESLEN